MNSKLVFAAVLVMLAVIALQDRSHGTPASDDSARATNSGPVAMLDLTKVFKNHERFVERSEELRAEVSSAEHALKQDRDAYASLERELKTLVKGTEEYQRMTAEMKKTADALKANVQRQKDEFLRKEATLYYEIYEQVQAAVREYATSHDIRLVLRFNGDRIDRSKPAQVLQELNKSVIYHSGIDITNDILDMLNGR